MRSWWNAWPAQVVLFLAGHGEQDVDGDSYLIMKEGCPRDVNLPERGLGVRRLVERITQNQNAKHCICIIDACRKYPDIELTKKTRGDSCGVS